MKRKLLFILILFAFFQNSLGSCNSNILSINSVALFQTGQKISFLFSDNIDESTITLCQQNLDNIFSNSSIFGQDSFCSFNQQNQMDVYLGDNFLLDSEKQLLLRIIQLKQKMDVIFLAEVLFLIL
jgi:hypothetical protein